MLVCPLDEFGHPEPLPEAVAVPDVVPKDWE